MTTHSLFNAELKSAVMKASKMQTEGGGPMKETPFNNLILYIIGDRSDTASGIELAMFGAFSSIKKHSSFRSNL